MSVRLSRSIRLIACVAILLVPVLSACGGAPTVLVPTTLPTSVEASSPVPPTDAPVPPTHVPDPTTVPPTPVVAAGLEAPSFQQQHTPVTDDLSADGYNWSQASPILIDKYGKIILPAQRHSTADKRNVFVYSNDGGTTWSDNSGLLEGFIERGTAAYDAHNDVIHMLWIGVSAGDGVFYRRYTPVRNAAQEITKIEQTADISLVLDKQTEGDMFYQHPVLLHLDDEAYGPYGALLAVWSTRNRGAGGGNEIRASMAILGDDPNAAGQAANWKAPIDNATSSIGNPPQVAYSTLAANTNAGIMHPSIIRKRAGTNAGDVYLFYHDGVAPGEWAFRRMRWSAEARDWSAGLTDAVPVSRERRAGVSIGYNLSQQLGARPVEDPARDRVYFGFANWKDDPSGDTWSFVFVDAAQGDALSPIVDVYSAGGPHSYAPAGDLAFDEASGLLVVSYVKTGTQHAFVRLYEGTNPAGDEIAAFDQAPVDIPLLAAQTRYGDPARLLMVFRDTVNSPNAPYHGWAGSLAWK